MKLTGTEEKLCGHIKHRAAMMLNDLRVHVGMPTGGNNRGALDQSRYLLTQRLSRLGAKIEMVPGTPQPEWLYGVEPSGYVPPTAVCRRPANRSGAVPVFLSGHLDTVHDPAGKFRELAIASDAKTATGPGCVDMKGGLVVAVAALEVLDEAGIDAAWTFVFNSDEETGSYCSEKTLRAEAAKVRTAGGVGLVFEPALPDGGLVVERLGSGQFMIEARGRSAHAGRDFEKGLSAITALADRLVSIARMSQAGRGKIANVGIVHGGTATNVVPDLARAWGNVRYPSREVADELGTGLDALATPGHGLPEVVIRRSFNRPAKPMIPETRALAEMARGVAEDLGQKLPFGKTGGVCDGNILQDEGLATIDTLGVRGGGLHTLQEWIELPSLVERCQLTAVLIGRIAAGGLGR